MSLNRRASPASRVITTKTPLRGVEWAVRTIMSAVIAASLYGAFLGLHSGSLWFDELFTMWIVQDTNTFGELKRRALTDTHPFTYSTLLWMWGQLSSSSPESLRAFSALFGVVTILVFIVGTAPILSLNARLFAAVCAIGSKYWFFYTANARNYTIGLLVSTIILVVALNILHRIRQQKPVSVLHHIFLFQWGLVGVFTHYYLMYVAVSVYGVLVLLARSHIERAKFFLSAILLVLVGFGYVHFVVKAFSQWDLENTWMSSTPQFFAWNLRETVEFSVSPTLVAGLTLLFLLSFTTSPTAMRLSPPPSLAASFKTGHFDAFLLGLLTCLGVLAMGIGSSVLLSPNFTARNVLLVCPFFWALIASATDLLSESLTPRRRMIALLSLGALSLFALVMIPQRHIPRTEPFRESARFISEQQGCESAPIRVLYSRAGAKPGYFEQLYPFVYGYYLTGNSQLQLVAAEDILAGKVAPWWSDNSSCPILLWNAHSIQGQNLEVILQAVTALHAEYDIERVPFPHHAFGYMSQRPVNNNTVVLLAKRR